MTGELRIPFRHHDRDGVIQVRITKIQTGVDAGFDVLPNLPFGPQATIGYPEMSATIAYSGTGYRQLMGWIQVVNTVRTWSTGEVANVTEVDLSAVWYDSGHPFFSYSFPASIYDAPSHNLNGADQLDWQANTFLTTVPIRSRDEPITPIASFAWGYSENSDPRTAPLIPAPTETDISAWINHRELLIRDFPSWSWS